MMTLHSQLTQLESSQLLRRVGDEEETYIFKHALTQDMAYASLAKQTRRTIHSRVAETIEQIYSERLNDYATLLAHHYAKAGDDSNTAEAELILSTDTQENALTHAQVALEFAESVRAIFRKRWRIAHVDRRSPRTNNSTLRPHNSRQRV